MALQDDALRYVSGYALGSNASSQGIDNFNPWDVYGSYLDRMNEVSQANSAASAAEAAKLRSWQEEQNRIAMDFNAKEAAKNRDWQEMMSNTAHQREVADLIAAGLNPILSATGGNGAAVTSGATASGVTSSGAKGDVDMSQNQGLASLLGSMLTAQTNLMNTMVNAQNNMAIAEKNNATNKLIAMLSNENQYEIAKIYKSLGMFQSLTGADATKSAAYLSYLASLYGSDIAYAIQRDFPNTWPAMIERLFQGLGFGPSSFGSNLRGWIDDTWNKVHNSGNSASDVVRNAVNYIAPGLGIVLPSRGDSSSDRKEYQRFSKFNQHFSKLLPWNDTWYSYKYNYSVRKK